MSLVLQIFYLATSYSFLHFTHILFSLYSMWMFLHFHSSFSNNCLCFGGWAFGVFTFFTCYFRLAFSALFCFCPLESILRQVRILSWILMRSFWTRPINRSFKHQSDGKILMAIPLNHARYCPAIRWYPDCTYSYYNIIVIVVNIMVMVMMMINITVVSDVTVQCIELSA